MLVVQTLFPNPNQNNNGSFVLRHSSPVHESLPIIRTFDCFIARMPVSVVGLLYHQT